MSAVAALTALCAGVLGPAQAAAAATYVPISGAGSTWAYPAIRLWANDVAQFALPVTYSATGSSSGRVLFSQGQVDWAQSDIPYGTNSFDPPPARGLAYVPDVAGGTALAYNLHIGGQQVTNLRLSGAVIAGIFTNRITRWNDPMIAADNPGLALPATAITPVVRSDGAGTTWNITQWMNATQGSYWTAYCAVLGLNPCASTSTYPVQPGTNMISVPSDAAVVNYVSQTAAEGAIGYADYIDALTLGLPVAKVLNAAGYYTAPTAGNVGVSLMNARFNTDPSSPLYLTADLSQVYTDPDPRTYELSSYSYLIVPTDLTNGFTTDKGNALAAFGQFALCQGQAQVDALGYSALPVNLVEAGYAQLQNIPGASLPANIAAFIASCNNPTFSPDGTNLLAQTAPAPPACDHQGSVQCNTGSPTNPAMPVAVNVPQVGAFTLTVDGTDTVTLTVNGSNATAPTTPILVSDTRNYYPGWSVSGQDGTWIGAGAAAGAAISGDQLGWTPTSSTAPLPPGVTLGSAVAPASPGLGTNPALLAFAVAGVGNGFGVTTLGADLDLLIPVLPVPQQAGSYTSGLTITAVTANP
jgi:ABC-type phosphate transport system substrate-binding protein